MYFSLNSPIIQTEVFKPTLFKNAVVQFIGLKKLMNQSLVPEPVRNRFNQGYKNLSVKRFRNA
jgi:hypothetical protein